MEQDTRRDQPIRDHLVAKLGLVAWGLKSGPTVTVINGTVHLWGLVSSVAEQAAMLAAARGVEGVRRVSDHTLLVQGKAQRPSRSIPLR